jgi:hypothetical protein
MRTRTHLNLRTYTRELLEYSGNISDFPQKEKMSLMNKQHIGLLIFDDDKDKTPLSNERTEALEWFNALDKHGQKQMLADNNLTRDELNWNSLLEAYRNIQSMANGN